MNTGTGTIALPTLRPLGTFLQSVTFAGSALGQRRDDNVLRSALGGIHERDVGLDLNIFTNQNLFLEGVAPTPRPTTRSTSERAEQILEVDITRESSTKASTTTEASTKAMETSSASEWVAATWVNSAVLIEGR
jgi:hypothetical protein